MAETILESLELGAEFDDEVTLLHIVTLELTAGFSDKVKTYGDVKVELPLSTEFDDIVICQLIRKLALSAEFGDTVTLEHQMNISDSFAASVECLTTGLPVDLELSCLFVDEVTLMDIGSLALSAEFSDEVVLTDIPYVVKWTKQTPPETTWTKSDRP